MFDFTPVRATQMLGPVVRELDDRGLKRDALFRLDRAAR
jgi:hypothetical protein